MDYRKLNAWTEKENFPMPFMDHMLDSLAEKGWYYFLDGYSGYNHISITPKDQENVVWVVQCTRHISEMYDVDILRHGGRYYRSFYG